MKKQILERIHEAGIVAILRGVEPSTLDATIDALLEGGIRCVEITLTSHHGSPYTSRDIAMIESTKARRGADMLVGAGTILEREEAAAALSAGADFILSPTLSVPVIELCNAHDRLAVPGVLTPTEALTATQAGAMIVKIFPAGIMGPGYLKDLRGPLPQIRTMPVGGVDLANCTAFFQAGAYALGIGSALFDPKLAASGSFGIIASRAREFVSAAASRK